MRCWKMLVSVELLPSSAGHIKDRGDHSCLLKSCKSFVNDLSGAYKADGVGEVGNNV